MDQRLIALFLHLKGLSAKEVDTELVQVLGSDAITYLTVRKYLQNDIILQNEHEPGTEQKIKVSRFQTMQFKRHLK
jgi:hypothetical protein